jgi:two-component system, NtrC family, response regulator AtoC
MSQPRERILILDDEPGMCRLLTAVLGDAGFRVTAFGDPQAALAAFERQPFDLVISDVSMPRVGGLDVLRRVKAKDPDAAVILITAYGTTKSAVEAIKLGTNDFIPKPFRNEEMRLAVEAVLERRRLARENASLRRELSARAGFGRLAGLGPAMRDACAALAEAA